MAESTAAPTVAELTEDLTVAMEVLGGPYGYKHNVDTATITIKEVN